MRPRGCTPRRALDSTSVLGVVRPEDGQRVHDLVFAEQNFVGHEITSFAHRIRAGPPFPRMAERRTNNGKSKPTTGIRTWYPAAADASRGATWAGGGTAQPMMPSALAERHQVHDLVFAEQNFEGHNISSISTHRPTIAAQSGPTRATRPKLAARSTIDIHRSADLGGRISRPTTDGQAFVLHVVCQPARQLRGSSPRTVGHPRRAGTS